MLRIRIIAKDPDNEEAWWNNCIGDTYPYLGADRKTIPTYITTNSDGEDLKISSRFCVVEFYLDGESYD